MTYRRPPGATSKTRLQGGGFAVIHPDAPGAAHNIVLFHFRGVGEPVEPRARRGAGECAADAAGDSFTWALCAHVRTGIEWKGSAIFSAERRDWIRHWGSGAVSGVPAHWFAALHDPGSLPGGAARGHSGVVLARDGADAVSNSVQLRDSRGGGGGACAERTPSHSPSDADSGRCAGFRGSALPGREFRAEPKGL